MMEPGKIGDPGHDERQDEIDEVESFDVDRHRSFLQVPVDDAGAWTGNRPGSAFTQFHLQRQRF
jgi:hypothetical protein